MEVNGERLEPFKPPFSVLELIRNTVAPEELPVIHSYLGESTIEYCKDLRNEMETLLEIWRDIGDRTEMPTVSKPISNPLPDPPIMREMLKKEIQILVKGVQDRHTVSGDQTLKEEKDVLKYVVQSQHLQQNFERPSTPIRHYTSETSYTTSPVKLKHVRSNINVKDIDKVASILKEAIQKECAALEHDIEFLQKCVEEEHDLVTSPPSTPMQEPSLNKLREVRKLLENQVLPDPVVINRQQGFGNSFSGKMSNSVIAKLPTPPSPTRSKLKPLPSLQPNMQGSLQKHRSAPSSPLQQRPSSVKPTSAGRYTTLRTVSAMSHSQNYDPEPIECWAEPSWTEQMSQSLPSTADSGVCSRPATCDLVALQDRMRVLELKSGRKSAEPETVSQPTTCDDGYATASSMDFNAPMKPSVSERKITSVPVKDRLRPTPGVSALGDQDIKLLKPRPPPVKVQTINRRNINIHRFNKKAIMTTDDRKIGARS
ncbi:uncharacterized protein LOC100176344 [Ciona intestinalis]